MSPSSRRAWIEISKLFVNILPLYGSPSSRRAWIEIAVYVDVTDAFDVALLAEGVDRNNTGDLIPIYLDVALLAEGVDRNCCP